MIRLRQAFLPEKQEIVIGTVTRIERHGIFLELDEYDGVQAYCHISELSNSWVKNIKSLFRVGEKVVGKVIRVDHRNKTVDISIKRVTEEHKKIKLQMWKKYNTAINYIKLAARQLKLDEEEILKEVKTKILEHYDHLFDVFEAAVDEGISAFEECGITGELAEKLTEIAKKNVVIPTKTVKGEYKIQCFEPNGAEVIRNAFKKAFEAVEKVKSDAALEVKTAGAPRYMIKITTRDYKDAEKILNTFNKVLEKELSNPRTIFEFKQIRS